MLGVGYSTLIVIGILILLDLRRFMIAVARVSVNHDESGGTAPDPLVWDQEGPKKSPQACCSGLMVDLASLPGPLGFLGGPWTKVSGSRISGAGIASWPYSVCVLVKFTSFLGTLHWPTGSDDFGHFGVSFLELLIFFEQWAGHHRLLSEKVTRPHVRANRPF